MSVKIARTVDDLTYPQAVDLPMSWDIVGSVVRAPRAPSVQIFGADRVKRAARMTQLALERVRDERSRPPTYRVVDIAGASMLYDELGDIFLAGDEDAAPVFPRAAQRFRRATGGIKFARVEPHDSYRQFRESDPEIAELRARVELLEDDFAAHTADGHGGAADRVVGEALRERRVPLSMPPGFEGGWDCWLTDDGSLACLALGLRGRDGKLLIATSATPVARHALDIVRCARLASCDVDELMGALPTLATMLAGGSVACHLAAAAPALVAHGGGPSAIVGLAPARPATIACLIGLLQDAQRGQSDARREWSDLATVARRLAHERAERLASCMRAARSILVGAQGGASELAVDGIALTEAKEAWEKARTAQDPGAWIFKGPSDAEVAELRAKYDALGVAFARKWGYDPRNQVTTPGGVLATRG